MFEILHWFMSESNDAQNDSKRAISVTLRIARGLNVVHAI
jgi:hypothetical protein